MALDTIETPHGKSNETLGGSAVHFALAASLLTQVRLVGNVGPDLGEEHVALLRRRGVDLAGLTRKEGKTFRWSGRYAADMNARETLAVELNVFGEPPVVPDEYLDSRFVFLANGSPKHQMEVLDRIRRAQCAVADSMDHWIRSDRPTLEALFRRVDAVVINDSEAKLLTGRDGPRAARDVLDMGPAYVIVKKGEHGALMVSRDSETFLIPAFPTTEVRDPTGAGDTFAGGLMGYLASVGKLTAPHLRRAMAYGTIMASFNVEDFGVRRVAALTTDEVQARLDQFKRMLEF